MKRKAKLVCIENDRPVTQADDGDFFYHYQRSVLLTLKQAGTLTETQYRHADEMLAEQFRSLSRTKIQEAGGKQI